MADRFRRLHVLCAAFLAGVVLANVLLTVLLKRGTLAPAAIPKNLSILLFASGLTLLVVAPAVKGAVFKRIGAEGFDSGMIFSAYQAANLAAFALREAAGLIGLVLALLTAEPWWSWGLGAGAVIAMAFDWPRREQLGL